MWHVKSMHTNASMISVCVLYISSKKTKHKNYTFECLSVHLEVLKRAFDVGLQSPNLPLQFKPQLVVCPRNKPIKYGNPYNLPLWLFRDKTTTHIDPHKIIETTGNSTLQRTKR